MRLRVSLVALSVALALVLLFSDNGSAENCTQYANSTVFDSPDYGPGCIDTGPGCNECVTTASRGAKVCYWVNFNDIYCIYTGQYPDNQM
jgi:hypothetical protein